MINNLIETAPPYTSVPINPGDVFTGPDFSLLCYTRNVTDPPDVLVSESQPGLSLKLVDQATFIQHSRR